VASARQQLTAGNLPAELSSFVGRVREVADVRKLLSVARVITLTGPGGIG
jgi:non-specific serine/threonine protein kinase